MKAAALLLACLLFAGCTDTPPLSGAPLPTATLGALPTSGDPHPDWPDTVVLAMPPGVRADEYADGLRYWNRQLASAVATNRDHPFIVEAFEPTDMADVVQAMADGRVNLAVLDAYWVVEAQRTTHIQVEQLALVDDRQEIVGGWIGRDLSLCADPPLGGALVATCNGADQITESAGSTSLEHLVSRRIELGDPTSALEYLLPARQLTLVGVDLHAVASVGEAEDRLSAICAGEADATVVPLPVVDVPVSCDGQQLVIFATTAAIPTAAIVTAGLPDLMAEQIGLQLAGQAGCEVRLDPSPCDPFWIPLWGEITMGQALNPNYGSVLDALN